MNVKMSIFKNPFKSRNFKFGAFSVIITVGVIVFIVLLNVLLTFLFKKYPLTIDLTENRAFEISAETEKYLASLDKDVVINIMNTETGFVSSNPTDYFVQANEVIRKYAQYSSRIQVEYVDLVRNPAFSSRFPEEKINVNDIVVTSGEQYRLVSAADLFNIRSSYYGSYVTSSKAEQTMTSALLGVSSSKKSLAAVIKGHNETEPTAFLELLKLNSYETTELNLITGEIPDDVTVLILAAPARDPDVEELRKINAFLENGNKRLFFYLASTTQGALPNLDEFLGDWGISADNGVVFESDSNKLLSPSPYIAMVNYTNDDYSQKMLQRDLFVVIPQARPLRAVFEQYRYRQVKTLLAFSPSSGIRPDDAPNDWVPSALQIRGNVPALLLSTQFRNNAAGDLVNAHVLVCGSSFTLDGAMLGSPNIANADYFLDLLGSLTGREDQIYISDKTMGFAQLGINVTQILVISGVFIVLLPLIVLGFGITVWLRRRHK